MLFYGYIYIPYTDTGVGAFGVCWYIWQMISILYVIYNIYTYTYYVSPQKISTKQETEEYIIEWIGT